MFIHLDIDCFLFLLTEPIDDSLFHIPVMVGGKQYKYFFIKKEIRKSQKTVVLC